MLAPFEAPVWSGFARVPEGRLSKAPLIAIVDDDEFFRGSMRRLMRSLGYPVEAFPSAADFLASRRLDKTACLIADIQMPGMTGVELYAHLIETGQKIPTILVTAYPDEARRPRALKDGIVGYLLKPFDDNDLMDCVRKAVEGGRPPVENS
ncbi:MAG TPA: response regulator [Stellaceae bacterium]|nr:response regulator [Stellaceae bacterium]